MISIFSDKAEWEDKPGLGGQDGVPDIFTQN